MIIIEFFLTPRRKFHGNLDCWQRALVVSAGLLAMRTTVLISAALLGTVLVVAQFSEVHKHSTWWTVLGKLCWKNATVRPPMLLALMVAGWGWVVKVCERARLDLERVLGGTCQRPAATYHAALIILAVVLASRVAHFVASETGGLTWRPWLCCNLALHLALLALGLLPYGFFDRSRLSLLRATLESMLAPLTPVTFWHVIVADYMTSLAKAFSDLQLTGCISYRIFSLGVSADYIRSTELWQVCLLSWLHDGSV